MYRNIVCYVVLMKKYFSNANWHSDLDATYKENSVDPAKWVSHFKVLLNIKPEISVDLKQHVDNVSFFNANKIFIELNYRISREESITVIQNLKKVKWQALMIY